MKSLFTIFSFVCSIGFSFAQTHSIPENIKTLFEGKWIIVRKYYTNTVEIKFEKDKDYATFIDIGTGEAPPHILKAYLQENKLVIPAKTHENDYVEMTVKNGKLIFKTCPTIEKEDGTFQKPDEKHLLSKVFTKVPLSAQESYSRKFFKTLSEYEEKATTSAGNDSILHLDFEKEFEALITNSKMAQFPTKELQRKCNTSAFCLKIQKSEDKNFILYTYASPFYHFNYITKTIKGNNKIKGYKIILKNNKWHEYFTQIHTLNNNEFLLIEQRDDLVFSCNYAYVYQSNGGQYKQKKAFENRLKLTVCNFTEIENPPNSDPEHQSLPVRTITFDYKNKTLFYGKCHDTNTGKTTTGKATYKNGKFAIKNCNDRKDVE
ncbi:hypothetical protein HYN56_04555 [Flavobacterium crocinum]|uniref:Lipocalin-like domain-containing protein n=1 Tax=Flavobacterium crocinum TaxID=2183896 RepID=A0A2S1YHL3_9FLAO|nr:hypothetical protein [Flavobacterium crocinum]AWK03531.1 hypothetical protein HYN56_04555 [Flavobacterium crocinum]